MNILSLYTCDVHTNVRSQALCKLFVLATTNVAVYVCPSIYCLLSVYYWGESISLSLIAKLLYIEFNLSHFVIHVMYRQIVDVLLWILLFFIWSIKMHIDLIYSLFKYLYCPSLPLPNPNHLEDVIFWSEFNVKRRIICFMPTNLLHCWLYVAVHTSQ